MKHGGLFGEQEDRNYVKPRYANIKPEGDIDPRDTVKVGQKGGGHSGGSEESREGKRGFDQLSRSRHSSIGRKIAAGSN